MNINKTAAKLAGVLLGGAVLAGIGAGTALATPAPASHPAASHHAATHPAKVMSQAVGLITNETPYTWTLEPGGQQDDHAPQTVAPEQVATFNASPGPTGTREIYYDFDGGPGYYQIVEIRITRSAGLQSFSWYGYPSNVSPCFRMQHDPDHDPLHVDAVWHNLVQVENDTPYTWTLESSDEKGAPRPQQTVAPGQTAYYDAAPDPNSDTDTIYGFTTSSGVGQAVEIDVLPGFRGPGLESFSWGPAYQGIYGTPSTLFHMQADPDGSVWHVDAVWNS